MPKPDITANFFKAGPVYTNRRHTYQAPEDVILFRARIITTFPGSDRRIAFGFMCSEDAKDNAEAWGATGMEDKHWNAADWKVKED